MSGRNTQRDLEREPFLDMHAQIAKTPMLHDTDPTVLILDKPIFQNVPRTPEPAPVLPDLASNIRGPNRSGAGTLYTQNIFIASGMGLLLRLAPLRLMSEHPSPNDLQTELLTELKKLTVSLRENGCTEIAATAARYILCAALDEAVLSTSWGAKSVWSQRSLLATLHGETWGGEKLFAMLSDRGPEGLLGQFDVALGRITSSKGDLERYNPEGQVSDKVIILVGGSLSGGTGGGLMYDIIQLITHRAFQNLGAHLPPRPGGIGGDEINADHIKLQHASCPLQQFEIAGMNTCCGICGDATQIAKR